MSSDPFRSAPTTSEEEEEWEIYSPSVEMGKKTKSKKCHKKHKKMRTSPSDQQQQQRQQERSEIEPESVQQKPERDVVEHRGHRQETNYFDPRELERYQQVNRTAENSSKMCSFCLITGHATADCDLRRQCKILNKLRCEFCEFYGHSIDDCPIYGIEVCSFCGEKGHDHERCETLIKAMKGPQKASKKSPPEAKKCTFCGDKGHNDEHCPDKEKVRRRSSLLNYSARTSSSNHSYTESKNNTMKYRFEENNKEKTSDESIREKCTFCGKNGHDDEHCPDKESVRENPFKSIYSLPNLDNWSTKDSATRTSSSNHSYTESKNNTKKYGFEENNKEKTADESIRKKCTFCGKNGHDDEHCPDKESVRENPFKSIYSPPNLDNWSTRDSATTFSSIHSQTKSENIIKINELEENNEKNITLDNKVEECTLCGIGGHDDEHCSMKKEAQEKPVLNYSTPDIDQNTKYSARNFSSSYPFSRSENNFFKVPGDIEEKNSNECTLQLKQGKGNSSDSERNLRQGSKSYLMQSINAFQSFFGLGSKPSDSDFENDEPFKEVKHKKRNKTLQCELRSEIGHKKENCPIPKELEKLDLYDQASKQATNETLVCELCLKHGHKRENCPMPKELEKLDLYDQASNHTRNEIFKCELCLEYGHEKENCPLTKEVEKPDLYNQASKHTRNETFKCELCLEYGHKKENCPLTKEVEKPDLYNQVSKQARNETFECELCLKHGHEKENCPMTKEFEKPDGYNQASKHTINETFKCELCLKHGHEKENCPMTKEFEKPDLYNQENKQARNETLECELCLEDGHRKANCPLTKESEKPDLYNEGYKDYECSSYSEYDKKKESYPVTKELGKYENNDSFDHINVNRGLPSYSDCLKDSKKNPKSSKNINVKKDFESDLCNKYRNMNLCNANQDDDKKKKKSSTEQLQEKISTGVKELLPIICTIHHYCYKCHPPLYYCNDHHKSCEFMNEILKLCDANVQKINCKICQRQCVFAEDPVEK